MTKEECKQFWVKLYIHTGRDYTYPTDINEYFGKIYNEKFIYFNEYDMLVSDLAKDGYIDNSAKFTDKFITDFIEDFGNEEN